MEFISSFFSTPLWHFFDNPLCKNQKIRSIRSTRENIKKRHRNIEKKIRTEIKNVVDIRYDKQQPLIAFVYDNDEMSVPTLDDFINSQTDFLSKNDYVYYVAFEFCK